MKRGKLFITWSETVYSKIRDCEIKIHRDSRELQEVYVICTSFEEERMCQKYKMDSLSLNTFVISHEQDVLSQSGKLKNFLDSSIHGDDQVFLLLENHTKPVNHLLTHLCAATFQKQIYYLSEDDYRITNFGYTQQEEISMDLIQHVQELIYSGNYHSAQVFLKEKAGNSPRINQLLQLGNQLFFLDFNNQNMQREQTPLELLYEILITHNIAEAGELKYLEALKESTKKQETFIQLLHNYASFLYELNDIIDFIVLYYRLVEESLLYALGWDINEYNEFVYRDDAIYQLDFPNWRLTKHYHRYNQALQQYILTIEKNKQLTISHRKQGFEKLSTREAYFADIYLAFTEKGISSCIDFRHEGVSGHGFADLTKTELEERCNGSTPIQILNDILKSLQLKPCYSIFELLNKAIMALLQEEVQKLELRI
ncbi:hypothetical protein ACWM35_10380 [Neobacillus sp. K501]